jgi:hypothetical protein
MLGFRLGLMPLLIDPHLPPSSCQLNSQALNVAVRSGHGVANLYFFGAYLAQFSFFAFLGFSDLDDEEERKRLSNDDEVDDLVSVWDGALVRGVLA